MNADPHARSGLPISREPDATEETCARLRQALDERIEFIEEMSHELRGGLTFVKGYVDLFLAGTLGPLQERQEHALRVMERRTDAIIHLLDQMLSLERARAGHLELSSHVDLSEVVYHSVQSAAVDAKKAGVELRVQVPDTCLLEWADSRRLIQVVDNLTSNAIKFSEAGDRVLISLHDRGESLELTVADEGIGMSAEDVERVFQRFYRTSQAAGKAPGSGLGLAIARAIVEAHQGRIWVESTPGKGSTFHVSLPKAGPQSNGRAGA
ncbi:MAG: HAMP domain-containing histidine kinase [Anaerolineae bacterium]|nr:HAMP domain-containing histidine kinase [Anaerolineae bacterium]